jgi:hypothetical protein
MIAPIITITIVLIYIVNIEFLHEFSQQVSWSTTLASNVAPNAMELCCTHVPDIDHNNNIGVESGVYTFDFTVGTISTTTIHNSVSLLFS